MEINFKYMKSWTNFWTKLVVFCLVTIILVAGCGTRKTETSKTEIKKDTLISVLSEKKVKVDSNYTFDFSTFKIYPIDISKPMLVHGIMFENAKIEGTKKIESGTLQKTTEVKEKEIKKGSNSEIIKTKQAEKTDNSNLYIGLFLIFCFFVFAYFKKWF